MEYPLRTGTLGTHHAKREVIFFAPEEDANDPDPTYRWKLPVNLQWCRDGDDLPRQELAHGETREQAEAMACRIAAAFMAEPDEIDSESWPTNAIDYPMTQEWRRVIVMPDGSRPAHLIGHWYLREEIVDSIMEDYPNGVRAVKETRFVTITTEV
jgi:hypothetical protein